MKTILTAAAVCLMAAMAFAETNTNTVVVAKLGNLRPGGKTPVVKASEFQEAEKIDLTDITKMPIGLILADTGQFDFSSAKSGIGELREPGAWSMGGKSEALRVSTVMVDGKTRAIVGATATCHFRSIQEGLFAITNDIYGAVRARPNARYLPPEIDKVKGTGKVLHFWPTADGRQWIELTTQFVMTKQGTMSINSLIHIQGDKLNTTLVH